jgi:hypothetical protein
MDPIRMIMELAFCSREIAEASYEEHHDIVECVDRIMVTPRQVGAPKQHVMSEEQQKMAEIRRIADGVNNSVNAGLSSMKLTSSDQSAPEESVDLPCLPEETAPQSNCSPEYPVPSPESEAQTQETACPSPSQCSSGSPCCART